MKKYSKMSKRFLALTLSMVLTLGALPGFSVYANESGLKLPPALTPQDINLDGAGYSDNSDDLEDLDFIPGEVLAPADSLVQAEEIATAYGLELKSYAYGIAVLTAPNPEQTVSRSKMMRRAADVPELSLNRLYTTDEVAVEPDMDYVRPGLPSIEQQNKYKTAYEYRKEKSDENQYEPYAFPYAETNDAQMALLSDTAQWHHEVMGNEYAWDISTGEGVVVAVIDTGIDLTHPEFTGRILENSYNSHTNKIGINYVQDDYGHGTHVTGIIAASQDYNDEDVCGVAPDASILTIKANIPEAPNYFETASLLRAINYATENGAHIINMSLGRHYWWGGPNELEHSVIKNAVDSGVTVICSAGNDGSNHAGYPAAYPETIAVSAIMQYNYSFDSWYSNYGPEIDISAPGTDIYSTENGGGYTYKTGTSMASPNVAGVAALVKSLNPDLTPLELREILCKTATKMDTFEWNKYYGHGIVNSYAAVLVDELCYVTYDLNYDGLSKSTYVIPGKSISLQYQPTRDGYAFDGWYTDENCSIPFDIDTIIYEDITLYANWVELIPGMIGFEFPDSNFRREVLRLINNYDNGIRWESSILSDLEYEILSSIGVLRLDDRGISDLTGIEYFTGLYHLDCRFNELKEVDVSKNTELSVLWLDYNYLTEIDVTNNTDLTELWLDNNYLTELDVTNNSILLSLWCVNNKLTELDLSYNTELIELWCYSNLLTELDLSNNKLLESLDCAYNRLTKIDITGCNNLKWVRCHYNYMKSIDDVIGWRQNPWLELDYSFRFDPQYNGEPPTGKDITDSFKDEAFLNCVRQEINKPDGQIYDYDVAFISALWISYKGISDLSGIENFVNLEELYCSGNMLTKLDLSENTLLEGFSCDNNYLTELNLSKNTRLKKLSCEYNSLTKLDVSSNTELVSIYCSGNQLTELNISNNRNLEMLVCYQNQLTELDLSNNDELIGLVCNNNPLTELDISNSRNLQGLSCEQCGLTKLDLSNANNLTQVDCSNNQLSKLDISKNSELTWLNCSGNQLAQLDLSNNSELTWLACYENQLTKLDLSNIRKLDQLRCGGNRITKLDISNNSELTLLSCYGNLLTELDLSNLSGLSVLECSGNPLKKLDLSNNSELTKLYCYGNQLTELDLSNLSELTALECDENQLKKLDISNNEELTKLYCYGNQLTKLDLSKTSKLERLYCGENQLTELNLSNNSELVLLSCRENQLTKLDLSKNNRLAIIECNGNQLTELDLSNNPELLSLACYENQLTKLDLSKNKRLHELYCGENKLTRLDLSNNSQLTWLSCYENQLTELDLSKNNGLVSLHCAGNQFTELNLLNNTQLIWLTCYGNQLTKLDLSKNNNLVEIHCGENQLTKLDLSNNSKLKWIACYGNQLTELDLSNNTELINLHCYGNQLTKLNLSRSNKLMELHCSDNKLTGLDLSNCASLMYVDCSYNLIGSIDNVLGWKQNPWLDLGYSFHFYPQFKGVKSVTVTPSTVSLQKGEKKQFAALINPAGGAPNTVNWSVDSNISYIDNNGLLTISQNETAKTLIVTATSTFDGTKYGQATVTVTNSTPSNGPSGGSGGSGGGPTYHTITFESNGGSEVKKAYIATDGVLTEPDKPTKKGFTFAGWYTDINLTNLYDFKKTVSNSFTLYAKWVQDVPQQTVVADEETPLGSITNPFTDVKEGDWFYNNVLFVNKNGLMLGTSATEFSPDMAITRGMVVTILYRMAESPDTNGTDNQFSDVAEGKYYANAVKWAVANGIVSGYGDGKFGPEDNITREQLSAILIRYANFSKATINETREYKGFSDEGEISGYAKDAIESLFKANIISGKQDGTFDPKGDATRAEFATILFKFYSK